MTKKCCFLTIVYVQFLTNNLKNPNKTTLKPLQALPTYFQLTSNSSSILLCPWQEMPQSRKNRFCETGVLCLTPPYWTGARRRTRELQTWDILGQFALAC